MPSPHLTRRLVLGAVALACLAAPSAALAGTLSANPSPLRFDTRLLGDGGNWQNLTITNDNTDATRIDTLSFGGADAGEFALANDGCSGQTLNPSQSCNLNVAWNPQSAGAKSAHLDVANDGAPSPLTVQLDATALAGPRAVLSPAAVSFPDTPVGGSDRQTVTVTNTGDSDLFVGELFVVTGTPQVFPVSSDDCSQPIAPDASCRLTVGFQPIAAGSKEATLFMITNTDRSPVTLLPMIGTGFVAATALGQVSPARPVSNRFTIVGRTLDAAHGRATVTVRVPGPGRIANVASASAAELSANGSGRDARPVVVGRARVTARGGGRFKLVLTPSARARAVLAARGRLHVSVTTTYVPAGGAARSRTIGLTLRLKRPRPS